MINLESLPTITHNDIKIRHFQRPFTFETSEFYGLYKKFLDKFSSYSFDDLRLIMQRCRACHARYEASQVVLPEGSENLDIAFVGRNPGVYENTYGRPFYPTAEAGMWLQQYLDSASLTREECYITNSLFCHTSNNRPPSAQELVQCSMWKPLELSKLSNLRYLFLLGNQTIRQFMGYDFPSITRCLGDVYQMLFQNKKIIVFMLPHPGFVMRKRDSYMAVLKYMKYSGLIIKTDREGKLKWLF